jgi:hypothetical protein
MYPRSSPREKVIAIGCIVFFGGLVWTSWLDDHPNPSRIHAILRTVAACCFVLPWIAGTADYFTGAWDRNPGIRAIHRNPDGVFWLRIAAVILFLGVLPLVWLWTYHSIHHLKP